MPGCIARQRSGFKDAEASLTGDGEDQARHLASGLQRRACGFDKVLTGPLVRAVRPPSRCCRTGARHRS